MDEKYEKRKVTRDTTSERNLSETESEIDKTLTLSKWAPLGGCISISDTNVHFHNELLCGPTRNHNHHQLECITPTDDRVNVVS